MFARCASRCRQSRKQAWAGAQVPQHGSGGNRRRPVGRQGRFKMLLKVACVKQQWWCCDTRLHTTREVLHGTVFARAPPPALPPSSP